MFAMAMVVVVKMVTRMGTCAVSEELREMHVASWGWQGGSGTFREGFKNLFTKSVCKGGTPLRN